MTQVYLAKLKEWWMGLAVREQRALAVGMVVVSLLVIYQVIWSPITSHVAMLRKKIQTQQAVLVWMRDVDRQIQQIEGHGAADEQINSPVALLGYVKKKITRAGMAGQLSELKQTSSDAVAIHLQQVDFDVLMALLTQMVKERQVGIVQLSIQAEGPPGIVTADVLFHCNIKS